MKRQASHKPARDSSPARDLARALLLALIVHVAALGLLWLGSLSWKPERPEITPSFTLVDASPYVEARREEQRAQEAQRLREEEAQRLQEQERREEAERQRALERQREQQRQEAQRQAELERQRQQRLEREAEQRRQQLEEERRQLEQERRDREQARQRELDELRRQREAAQREREEQERRLAEIAEQREREAERRRAEQEAERLRLAREQAAAEERRGTLRDEYVATIAELVRRNWIRPPTTRPGVRCSVRVVQIPGGEIIDQAVASPCNADPATRRSIISAVERAAVLPYRGYEDVFEREIIFEFSYDG